MELPTMFVVLFMTIATLVLSEAVTNKSDRLLVLERLGEVPSCFIRCRVSELSVDCSQANCTSIPKELNGTTVNLIMTGSRLSCLSNESFEHIPNLQYLDLGNCHIE